MGLIRLKILLIVPWEKNHKRYRGITSRLFSYSQLTLATLATLVPKELDADITICDEMVDDADKYLNNNYDIVGISVIASESGRAYQLAKKYKEKGSYIILGGHHVSMNPDEASLHGETIVVGAGDLAWPQFLYDYKNNHPQKKYEINITGKDILHVNREYIIKDRYLPVPTLIANRGCGNKCGFCAISRMWDSMPRPIDAVIDEIKRLNSKKIIFFDPNFFYDRDYSLELMSELEKLNIGWAGAGTIVTGFDEELLTAAEKSGCGGLLTGLESLQSKSLQGVDKDFNRPEKYRESISNFKSHGININGCFVLGMDGDTEETLLALPEKIDYLGLNLARFSILTPAPGSPLFKKLDSEGRILTRDWSQYTQTKAVFQPKNMSPERLEEIFEEVWKRTYSWKRVFKRGIAGHNDFADTLQLLGANIGFKFIGKDS